MCEVLGVFLLFPFKATAKRVPSEKADPDHGLVAAAKVSEEGCELGSLCTSIDTSRSRGSVPCKKFAVGGTGMWLEMN